MDNASDLQLFLQQRRDECFKHIGKVMFESCPELVDISVADMRKAGRYLHKFLTRKAPSQGVAPARNGARRVRFGGMSVPDGREPMPVSGYGSGRTSSSKHCRGYGRLANSVVNCKR